MVAAHGALTSVTAAAEESRARGSRRLSRCSGKSRRETPVLTPAVPRRDAFPAYAERERGRKKRRRHCRHHPHKGHILRHPPNAGEGKGVEERALTQRRPERLLERRNVLAKESARRRNRYCNDCAAGQPCENGTNDSHCAARARSESGANSSGRTIATSYLGVQREKRDIRAWNAAGHASPCTIEKRREQRRDAVYKRGRFLLSPAAPPARPDGT